jgi:GT2 family glycosyltransferase
MLYMELAPEPVRLRAVPIGGGAVLAEIPAALSATLAQSGLPGLSPPFGSVAISGPGGERTLAALRPPADLADMEPNEITLAIDAAGDPFDLCTSLDSASGGRLLDFLLGFCRTAFRIGADGDFAALARRVARDCAIPGGEVTALATVPHGRMLVRGGDWTGPVFLLGRAGVCLLERQTDRRAALRVIAALDADDLLVTTGAQPRLWTVAGVGPALPHVLALIDSQPSARRDIRAACARALLPARAASDAALLRELQVLAPAEPRGHTDPARPLQGVLDIAIADGQDGVFLRGWLHDPLELVQSVAVSSSGNTLELGPDALHRMPRGDLGKVVDGAAFRGEQAATGFVAFCRAPFLAHVLQPTLSLRLRSGATIELVPPARTWPLAEARDAVLSSLGTPAPDDPAMREVIIPVAARLHDAAMRAPRAVSVRRIGQPARAPRQSVLVPLYRTLRFLRFQVAAFANDPDFAQAEVIYALDSPEQAGEVEHLLRGLHLMHGLPLTLVVMPRNCGYAAATNEAARVARGASLLLLNSDVVPVAPGWLGTLQQALDAAGAAAAGPKLLLDDGSLQHAGLYFERWTDGLWLNRHYYKGLPRLWPGASDRREVPAVTGAALLVQRDDYEAVGGVCEDYVIGDYEDSDLCLRLRESGAPILYVPEAELFHFERRSISLHQGYTRTTASLYNRLLHHQRWDADIAALMARQDMALAA